MSKSYRIGLIGLDTSHVEAFTKLLNDPDAKHHVGGGEVVAGYPGGSEDFDLSISRVDGYTEKLRDEFGVKIYDNPEAVAECCDLVFITSVDGRVHKDIFERIAKYGKPTFIDKPFTTDLQNAKAILELADESGITVMSCSSLRYAENFQAALGDNDELGEIIGCDAFGPMDIRGPMAGLYWYGIHTVEMLVAAMGTGCCEVKVTKNQNTDMVIAEWEGGRICTIRGLRNSHSKFGVTLHREKGFEAIDIQANDKPLYAGMLEAILSSLPKGHSDVPNDEILEVVGIIDAANKSRETGKAVKIDM